MYFIYDCHGNIIGNPKGYRTFRGANQQANGRTKLRNLIWDIFDAREDKNNKLIHKIQLEEQLVHKSIKAGI